MNSVSTSALKAPIIFRFCWKSRRPVWCGFLSIQSTKTRLKLSRFHHSTHTHTHLGQQEAWADRQLQPFTVTFLSPSSPSNLSRLWDETEARLSTCVHLIQLNKVMVCETAKRQTAAQTDRLADRAGPRLLLLFIISSGNFDNRLSVKRGGINLILTIAGKTHTHTHAHTVACTHTVTHNVCLHSIAVQLRVYSPLGSCALFTVCMRCSLDVVRPFFFL